MKKVLLILVLVVAAMWGSDVQAQNIAAVKNRLSLGENAVSVTEQSDASATVRAVEQRPKRTKVSGYTILLLSDNSHQAREKAVEARDLFLNTFPNIEVDMYYESPSFYVTAGRYLTKEEAIIELWRFRSIFPKAITQSREMDISDFVIAPKPVVEIKQDSVQVQPLM
ncbi:MAG: hypothetical protein IKM03_07435 [Alistipes sp.]|nr:hypothetical protein [Alistipes sp.]